MEQRTFDYSLKNIPIPSEKLYMKRPIEKVKDVIKRMRWKAHFFVKGDNNDGMQQMFGFKSRKYPPKVKDMENVESELVEMTQNIKFRKTHFKEH